MKQKADLLSKIIAESEEAMEAFRRERRVGSGEGSIAAIFRISAPRTVDQEYEYCMNYMHFMREWMLLRRETELMLADSRFFARMSPLWEADIQSATALHGFDHVLDVNNRLVETRSFAEWVIDQAETRRVLKLADEIQRQQFILDGMNHLQIHQEFCNQMWLDQDRQSMKNADATMNQNLVPTGPTGMS